MAEQLALSGMALKRDVEWAIVGSAADTNYDGTPATAPSATSARYITNFWSQVATNTTITPADADDDWRSAAVASVELDINEAATAMYNSGGLTYKMGNAFVKNANMMVMSPANKARLDALLDGKTNSRRDVGAMEIQGTMFRKYATSFGDFAMVPDLQCVGTNVGMYNPMNWKWVTLRPTHVQDLAKTGDSENRQIVMEGTLIHRHTQASAQLTGLIG